MLQEKKLIKKAKYNKEAFLELYNNYYPKLYAYLLVRTKDKELTEDILQDTFVKSLQALKNYEYKGKSFGAWLFRIATNEMISQWRRSHKTTSYGDEKMLESKMKVSVTSPEEELIEKENLLLQDERQQQLLSVLDKLPEKEKELVVLKYISKLSYKEIAVIYNTRPGNLAVRLHRILNKLKDLID